MNCKPGNPSGGGDGTAEVNIYRETVGFRAHIEYRGTGEPADILLDTGSLRAAERRVYRYMGELGYAGTGPRWYRNEGGPVVTRLFRKLPGESS